MVQMHNLQIEESLGPWSRNMDELGMQISLYLINLLLLHSTCNISNNLIYFLESFEIFFAILFDSLTIDCFSWWQIWRWYFPTMVYNIGQSYSWKKSKLIVLNRFLTHRTRLKSWPSLHSFPSSTMILLLDCAKVQCQCFLVI